jgi:hypothetical protein
MIKIILEPARNGVIKRLTDDNYGGAKQAVSTVDVYESQTDGEDRFSHIMRFFYDLCEDLGMDLGNKFERETLQFTKEWGSHYEPNEAEVDRRMKELKAELDLLREWKKG